MEWLAFGLGALSFMTVPLAWGVVFLRRRRHRGYVRHNTTPPVSMVTTGQHR